MSSRLTPHEESTKRHSSSSMLEPISLYSETTAPPTISPERSPSPLPGDEPPVYAVPDATQTTFSIYGTFIHTPAGPAYQLSSPLDQRGPFFRIRRLRAKEAQQVGSAPVAFDKSYILYEVNDPPLLDNEYHMQGKRRTCLPGVIEIKYRLGRWKITHVPRPGAKGKEILSCKKVGTIRRKKLDQKPELEASEWRDAQGRVLATEVLKVAEDSSVVPTIELSKDLDQTWRELLLSLWATRLWVSFGWKKTKELGDNYAGVRIAKHSGSGRDVSTGAMVGMVMLG